MYAEIGIMSPCLQIFSHLDFYNQFWLVSVQSNMLKLKGVQNSLTGAITIASKYELVASVHEILHRLYVQQRICFKLGIIFHKTLNSGQQQYLKSVLTLRSSHYSTRPSECLSGSYLKLELFLVKKLFWLHWI